MRFIKKPIKIEAFRWDSDSHHSCLQAKLIPDIKIEGNILLINTLEGTMTANTGDWIIKGINGEYYPCKNDIFIKTYKRAEK